MRPQDQGPLRPQQCTLYGRPSHVQTSRSEGPLHHGPDLQTILTRAAHSENKQLFPALARLQVRSQTSTRPTESRPAGRVGVSSSTTWTVRRDEDCDRRAEQQQIVLSVHMAGISQQGAVPCSACPQTTGELQRQRGGQRGPASSQAGPLDHRCSTWLHLRGGVAHPGPCSPPTAHIQAPPPAWWSHCALKQRNRPAWPSTCGGPSPGAAAARRVRSSASVTSVLEAALSRWPGHHSGPQVDAAPRPSCPRRRHCAANPTPRSRATVAHRALLCVQHTDRSTQRRDFTSKTSCQLQEGSPSRRLTGSAHSAQTRRSGLAGHPQLLEPTGP